MYMLAAIINKGVNRWKRPKTYYTVLKFFLLSPLVISSFNFNGLSINLSNKKYDKKLGSLTIIKIYNRVSASSPHKPCKMQIEMAAKTAQKLACS